MALLQQQVEGMSRVLALQEKAMGRAKLASCGNRSELCTAYDDVLSKWRETVFELMVERACGRWRSQEPEEKASHENELASLALEAERERSSAFEARASTERQRAVRAESKLLEAANESRTMAVELETLRSMRDGVRLAAEAASRELSASTAGSEATLLVATSRVEEETARLALCRERLSTLSKLLGQRDVKLRNAAAAIAADRRLWRRERCEAELSALSLNAEEGTDAALPVLRPEAEAVARSVFCELDAAGRGCVDRKELSTALREEPRLRRLMSHWIGERAWDRTLESLEAELGLRHELDDDAPEERRLDVTWGEFLLLFVPKAAGDVDSPEPLTLAHTRDVNDHFDMLGLEALRLEARRLARERQAMSRALASTERSALRARDEVALLWRHETTANRRRIEQLERDIRLEKRDKTDLEAALAAETARARAEIERSRKLLEDADADARHALEKKSRDLDTLTRKAKTGAETAQAEISRLTAALDAASRDRDLALAEAHAFERERTTLNSQLQARDADYTAQRSQDARAADSKLTAVRRERDALLRILKEHRRPSSGKRAHSVLDDRSVLDHSEEGDDGSERRPPSVSSNARTSSRMSQHKLDRDCLGKLRALTEDLLDDFDDEDDDDDDNNDGDSMYH